MTIDSTVLVFKTNITNLSDLHSVAPMLTGEQDILKWNVDLHDIDKVLRIETNNLNPLEIANLLQGAGFLCEELPD